MIGALLRADGGIFGLKLNFVILVILLAPLALMWDFDPEDPALRFIFLSVVLAFWLVGLNAVPPQRRFSEFQLMQPAPPSLLLAVRIVALCLHGLMPLAVATTMAVLFGRADALVLLPVAANLGSAVVFASVVLHLPSPGFDKVVDRSKVSAALALGGAAFFGAAWIEDPRYGLALLAAAAVLARVIRRALPPGLLMTAAGKVEGGRVEPRDRARRPRRLLAGWILRKTLLSGSTLAMAIVAVSSALQSIWFLFVLLSLFAGSAFRGLAGVGHLPLSRRQLFPYVALPTFLWVVISFAAGSVFHAYVDHGRRSSYEPVDMTAKYITSSDGDRESFSQILVPASHWRLGFGKDAPPTRAPWGEEVSPRSYVLSVWGRPIHLYNPYEVSASSSIEFVSWQLSRAVEDVYGARMSPEDFREKYLEKDEEGTVVVRQRYFTMQELRSHFTRSKVRLERPILFTLRMDHPELTPGPPRTLTTHLATVFLLCVVSWVPVLLCGLLASRPPTTVKGADRRKWFLAGSIVLIFFVAGGLGELTSRWSPLSWEWYVPSAFEAVTAVTFRTAAEILPENGLFSWTVVLAVAVALYLFLERVFSRMEIPRPWRPSAKT